MSKSLKEFIAGTDWHVMGKWKHTGISECAVAEAIVSPSLITVIPFQPRYYMALGNTQLLPEKDYRQNVQDTEQLLKARPRELADRLIKEIKASIELLFQFQPDTLNAKTIGSYLDLVGWHGRQWYEIMLADGALHNIFKPIGIPIKSPLALAKAFDLNVIAECVETQEQYDLLQIAIEEQKGRPIDGDLSEHARRYGWMNSLCWWNEPFETGHYRQAIKEISGNPVEQFWDMKAKRAEQSRQGEELLETLRTAYPDAWVYLDIIRDLADVKEDNWDVVSIVGARLRAVFEEFGKNVALSYNQLMMLSPQEMKLFFNSQNLPVTVDELNDRMKCVAFISSAERTEIQSGRRARILVESISQNVPSLDHLTGTVIWRGKEQGVARVLHSPDDIGKMRTGEILVCPMTDPDYMPAIHKAKAVVTDQGGFLCHAAIVARELQKICIVGTKIATKVFKDGDLVEVDAERGVVRKLKV